MRGAANARAYATAACARHEKRCAGASEEAPTTPKTDVGRRHTRGRVDMPHLSWGAVERHVGSVGPNATFDDGIFRLPLGKVVRAAAWQKEAK